MGRRSRKAEWYAETREPTAVREDIEQRWFERLDPEPRLAAMVTAERAQYEPFHRWLRLRQGFAPALVRLFLSEYDELREAGGGQTVLDPFSGSGTTVVECARRGTPSLGVEAVASSVFLTRTCFAREFPAAPSLPEVAEWQALAPRLEHELHRAALMLAVARQHTAAGKPNRGAPPLHVLLQETLAMMADDLRHPLALIGDVGVGDARDLSAIDDESIGGIITSPPYLSRHDYDRITLPAESVYRFWYDDLEAAGDAPRQLRAHAPRLAPHGGSVDSDPDIFEPGEAAPLVDDDGDAHEPYGDERPVSVGAPGRRWRNRRERQSDADGRATVDAAVAEIGQALAAAGQARLGRLAADYFDDLRNVLQESHRVLRDGAPMWLVIGGARLRDVYVPSDLLAAEIAAESGFDVLSARVARDLVGARRKFGRAGHIAPRETLLVLRKS
jgi:hypothetical protein